MTPPRHPWEILIDLAAAGHITSTDVRNVVMAHENVLRRAIREVRALLPDLIQNDDITSQGARRLEAALLRASHEEAPDL